MLAAFPKIKILCLPLALRMCLVFLNLSQNIFFLFISHETTCMVVIKSRELVRKIIIDRDSVSDKIARR